MLRLLLVSSLVLAGTARAQEFVPPGRSGNERPDPEESTDGSGSTGVRFALDGFSAKLGADFTADDQAVIAVGLDLGNLYSEQVRMRLSGEFGFGSGVTTYLVNAELLYHFMPDSAPAIPYVGFGLGVWGRQDCATTAGCPGVWPVFALGFELQLREHINWILEYHGEDALSRHRVFLGLSTRRMR